MGKLFISTGYGGALKNSHFIICLYRTVIEVNYFSRRSYLFQKNSSPPPSGNQMVTPLVSLPFTRVRGSFPGLDGSKETKMLLSHLLIKLSVVGSLHDREVACLAPDFQGLNFKSGLISFYFYCIAREKAVTAYISTMQLLPSALHNIVATPYCKNVNM